MPNISLRHITIVFIGFYLLIACVAPPISTTKNEYVLTIINTIDNYLYTVKQDSNKQMVALNKLVPRLKNVWPYATTNNFTHQILYNHPTAYMRIEAAIALQKVSEELYTQHIGLKIFDAYRPYSVTKKMWEVVPDDRYAANPAKGSGHNRGAAVDLTLYDLTTGTELQMPTPFDDFTEKAHHNYMNLDTTVLKNRKLLKDAMEKYGFVALDTEWWHYFLPNAAKRFELLDLDFKQMAKAVQ